MPEPNSSILGTPPTPEPPKQKFTWVFWLIVAVIVLAVAGIVVASIAAHHLASRISELPAASPYGQGGSALEGPGGSSGFGGDGIPNTAYEDMTFDEIVSASGLTAGNPSGTDFGTGVYRVGAEGIPAGLYYLGGSQTVQGAYQLYDRDDESTDHYDLDDSVIYFGNYFATLEDGDVIAYNPGGNETMHVQSADPLGVTAPYQSGVYRVGIDIPAGTYTITVESQSREAATSESAAFVMKDLAFNDDSIVETKYVRVGGRQSVTVSDGQYLELYAAEATPGAPAQDNQGQSSQGTAPGNTQDNGAGSSGGQNYYYHHPEEHHTAMTATDEQSRGGNPWNPGCENGVCRGCCWDA